MYTIIIGDGLTNEALSPENQFQGSPENVGLREIARLLGRGKTFGEGPLPTFLRFASSAHAEGKPVGVILLRSSSGRENDQDDQVSADPTSFVAPFAAAESEATVLTSSDGPIPWQDILAAVARFHTYDPRQIMPGSRPREPAIRTRSSRAARSTRSSGGRSVPKLSTVYHPARRGLCERPFRR